MNYSFSHTLAGGKKAKAAFVSLTVTLGLCVAGYAIAEFFWDTYTYQAYSLRYGTQVTAGWPASLQGWSLWLGIAILLAMPMMYFMQDWKNPSLALAPEGLFINQQMIRNQLIPFASISGIEKTENGYRILFKDPALIYNKTGFYKPFVKSNLKNGTFFISEIHSSGDLEAFFAELTKRIG